MMFSGRIVAGQAMNCLGSWRCRARRPYLDHWARTRNPWHGSGGRSTMHRLLGHLLALRELTGRPLHRSVAVRAASPRGDESRERHHSHRAYRCHLAVGEAGRRQDSITTRLEGNVRIIAAANWRSMNRFFSSSRDGEKPARETRQTRELRERSGVSSRMPRGLAVRRM